MREHIENLEDDEKTKIIKSAIKLIQNDIAMVNLNSLVSDMVDLDWQTECDSQEFQIFVETPCKIW